MNSRESSKTGPDAMLNKQPDSGGTLILSRLPDGRIHACGQSEFSGGYTVTGTNTDEGEGVWVRWTWDGRELQVRNDRFGFFPIYFAQIGSGFGVSTSALELLSAGADRDPDDAAMAVFMRLGYYIGNDTPFRSVKLLPPGSLLRWTESGLTVTSSAPSLPQSESALSREQAIWEYGHRFQTAVEQMLPSASERMCVPLSAGRDSRHILFALLHAGCRPERVVTLQSPPPRPNTDAQVAAQITAATGLPHTILEQSPNRFEDELEKDLLTCFCADEHAQMIPLKRWLNSERMTVSWDGIAGDIFSCGVYNDSTMLDQFRHRQFGQLCDWLLNTEGYLPSMLSPDHSERWGRGIAIKRLTRELEQYADLPNPAAPFFFYNRVRRELALSPFGMLNQTTSVLAPFLSHAVFDLLINLPFSYFRGREFHSEAISQFYPDMPRFEFISSPVGTVPERRTRIWRYVRGLGQLAASQPSAGSSIERRFLFPRLAKAMLHRGYGTELPVLFSRVLVMLHLERSMRQLGTELGS